MLSLTRNPTALKFNVSKKLSQLMKVIHLFRAEIAEREFQKKFLHEKFESEIMAAIDRYNKEAHDIEKSASESHDKILEKVAKCFEKKQQLQLDEINAFIELSSDNIAKFEKKILDDMSNIQLQSKKILDEISVKSHEYEKVMDGFKDKLDLIIKESLKNFNKEISSLDDESNNKIKKLLGENKSHLNNINEEHKKKIDEIYSSSKNNDSNNEIVQKIRDSKQSLQVITQMMQNIQKNILQIKETSAKNYKNIREKLREITNAIEMSKKKELENVNSLTRDLDELNSKGRSDLELLENKLNEANHMHKEALQNLKNQQQENYKKMQEEYSELSRKYKEMFDCSDAEFLKLQERNEEEIKKLKKNYDESESQSVLKYNQKKDEIKLIFDDNLKSLDNAKLNGEKEREDNRMKINDQNTKYRKKISDLKEQNDQEIEEKKKLIENSINDATGNSQKLNQSYNNLNKQKDELTERYKSDKISFDNDTKRITDELKKGFVELDELKHKNLDEFNSLEGNLDKEFEDLKNRIEMEFDDTKLRLEQKHGKIIAEIRENEHGKNELAEFVVMYQKQYDEQNKSLDQYNNIQTEFDFSELDKIITELESQKDEIEQLKIRQKVDIERQHEEQMLNEKQRHMSAMDVADDSDSKSAMQERIYSQIAEEKNFRASNERNLKNDIENENERHTKVVNELKTALNAIDSSDVSKLSNQTDELKRELDSLLQKCEALLLDEEQKFKQRIDLENSQKNDNEEKMKQQLKMFSEEYLKTVSEITRDMEESDKRDVAAIDNITQLNGQKILAASRQHSSNVKDLTKQIDELTQQTSLFLSQSKKSLISEENRLQSEISEYSRTCSLDIEKMINNSKTMCDFYDEKFEALQKKLTHFTEQWNSRPPREQDIRYIERLENRLAAVTYQLKSCIVDMKRYKEISQDQESKYNKHFGMKPKVAVYKGSEGSILTQNQSTQSAPPSNSIVSRASSVLVNSTRD